MFPTAVTKGNHQWTNLSPWKRTLHYSQLDIPHLAKRRNHLDTSHQRCGLKTVNGAADRKELWGPISSTVCSDLCYTESQLRDWPPATGASLLIQSCSKQNISTPFYCVYLRRTAFIKMTQQVSLQCVSSLFKESYKCFFFKTANYFTIIYTKKCVIS